MFISEICLCTCVSLHLSMTYVICYGVVMGLYVLWHSAFFFLYTQDLSGLLRSRCLFPGDFLMRSNYLGEYIFPTKIAFLQKLDKNLTKVKVKKFLLLVFILSTVTLELCYCQSAARPTSAVL